jgi:hypothetical protein
MREGGMESMQKKMILTFLDEKWLGVPGTTVLLATLALTSFLNFMWSLEDNCTKNCAWGDRWSRRPTYHGFYYVFHTFHVCFWGSSEILNWNLLWNASPCSGIYSLQRSVEWNKFYRLWSAEAPSCGYTGTPPPPPRALPHPSLRKLDHDEGDALAAVSIIQLSFA